jgi:hypothetical protein
MYKTRCLAAAGALVLLAAGCKSDTFLTGGDLSNDPNRPVQATSAQLFVGIEANVWAEEQSDMARITNMWAQQLLGTNFQYVNIYDYGVSESTTGGFHATLYGGGGLYDIRQLQAQTLAARDTVFAGIAQVMEGLLMGRGADLFGDLVYSQALKNTPNPPLDPQLSVYDAVQAVLSSAIVNLQATGPTNQGPGAGDLSYGGNAAKWTKLAHLLKARLYMHTAKVQTGAYAKALAEAPLGITAPADNFNAVFSGNSSEQNFWYQFDVVARFGYIAPNPQFVTLLQSRGDPRLGSYFNSDQSDLNPKLVLPNHTQPMATANEGLLIWSEAAYRTGDPATALTKLNAARALAGLGPEPAGLSGQALLAEILTEQYIADFQTIESWMLYKRTCSPNLTPVLAGSKIPARFFYDVSERNTDTAIPLPSKQPARNQADPASTLSDATGQACLGQ